MKANKRSQKRINININVSLSHESKLQKLYSQNLSKGGIYLSADVLLPIGKKVTLEFDIEEIGKKFKVQAEVVHHHSYESFDDESTVSSHKGMGFRFVNISKDDQDIIDRYILGKELKKGA